VVSTGRGVGGVVAGGKNLGTGREARPTGGMGFCGPCRWLNVIRERNPQVRGASACCQPLLLQRMLFG
jgi:hypothetical protein